MVGWRKAFIDGKELSFINQREGCEIGGTGWVRLVILFTVAAGTSTASSYTESVAFSATVLSQRLISCCSCLFSTIPSFSYTLYVVLVLTARVSEFNPCQLVVLVKHPPQLDTIVLLKVLHRGRELMIASRLETLLARMHDDEIPTRDNTLPVVWI